MNSDERGETKSVFRSLLSTFWKLEEDTWRWAAALGLLGAFFGAAIAGFFGFAAYGYLGMIGGGILGGIISWVLATLVFYCLLSTASLLS